MRSVVKCLSIVALTIIGTVQMNGTALGQQCQQAVPGCAVAPAAMKFAVPQMQYSYVPVVQQAVPLAVYTVPSAPTVQLNVQSYAVPLVQQAVPVYAPPVVQQAVPVYQQQVIRQQAVIRQAPVYVAPAQQVIPQRIPPAAIGGGGKSRSFTLFQRTVTR